jgi:hypothetical protein
MPLTEIVSEQVPLHAVPHLVSHMHRQRLIDCA